MLENKLIKPDKAVQKAMLDDITLGVSTQWYAFPHRFDWIVDNGFGMAYTPDGRQLNLTKNHVEPYLQQGTPIRYHGYFPGFEIGNRDHLLAEEALTLHKQSVDAMTGLGEQFMTVHIGLVPDIDIDHNRAIRNLTRLVYYAKERGITISLENLRFGPTSNPEIVLKWSEESGSTITLDVGHAVCCDRVTKGELTVLQIIEMFQHNLEEVHFYEYETDTHHAPKDMSILGPIVDSLLDTECKWWTIELASYHDILNTRNLTNKYLADKAVQIVA